MATATRRPNVRPVLTATEADIIAEVLSERIAAARLAYANVEARHAATGNFESVLQARMDTIVRLSAARIAISDAIHASTDR